MNRSGVLVVTEMFWPTWVAMRGGSVLPTVSVSPGLLGVALPPGTTMVRLVPRNVAWTVATMLAWSAVAASVAWPLLSCRGRSHRGTSRAA